MPDWIIHMGVAHAAGRPARWWDLRWLLLGAVLPDAVPRVVAYAADLVLGGLGPPGVYLYFVYLHTPVSVALLAGALVAVAADRRAAALGLAFGAATHFALDVLQRSFSGGTSLLYPIDVRGRSLQVAWYTNAVTPVLVALFGLSLLIVWLRRRGTAEPTPPFCFTWRRVAIAATCVAICLLLPWSAIDRGYRINLHNSRFVAVPGSFDGRLVGTSGAKVRDVDDRYLVVEIMDEAFSATRPPTLDVVLGDTVSLRGVYRGGQIETEEVVIQQYVFKKVASAVGALLLLAFWAPALRAQWVASGRASRTARRGATER